MINPCRFLLVLPGLLGVPASPAAPAPPSEGVVSVNLLPSDCRGLSPAAVAGVVRADHWNNLIGPVATGVAVTLADPLSSGGARLAGVSITVTGGAGVSTHRRSPESDDDAGVFATVTDQSDGTPGSISVSGLPFRICDVYLYLYDDGALRGGSATLGTQTLHVRGGVGNPKAGGPGYVRSNDSSFGAGTDIDQGNYLRFENVAGPSFTVTYTALPCGDRTQRLKVAGFQIVNTGGAFAEPVPIVTSFTATPGSAWAPGPVTLSWNVANATAVRIDPDLGPVAASGSVTVQPSGSRTWRLSARRDQGPVVSAEVVHRLAARPEPRDSVWQFSVPVEGAEDSRAYLWVPPAAPRLRALIVAQHNMEEIHILENPRFRRAMAELGIGMVWVARPFDHLFRFDQGAGAVFTRFMGDLAAASGYEEINYAPIVTLGHSAAASWPYYFAAWKPERTLAVLSVSGQWPYFRHEQWAPDIWGDRTIDHVPCLESMGEYESADTWSAGGLRDRQAHPLTPLSMLANPGQGHFASSDAKAAYLALYLRKAAQYRLPADAPEGRAPRLVPIDPTKTGWLADKWRRDRAPEAPAAPVGAYTGNPKEAFWYFDEELARATERYQAAWRGLKPQLVGYTQEGMLVGQGDSHAQVRLRFLPEADGVTFRLGTAFLDTVPAVSGRLTGWTQLPVGASLGHADGPITIEKICGPFVQTAPEAFVLQFDREAIYAQKKGQISLWFAAVQAGDATYKPAVQQAEMVVPTGYQEGAAQTIAFPPVGTRPAAAGPIKLGATSSAGLPVSYTVLSGPAEVEGDSLRVTQLPARARFPLEVKVIAWQWGRPVAPKVRGAEPVEQTFLLTR